MIKEIHLSNFYSIKEEVVLDLKAGNLKTQKSQDLSRNVFDFNFNNFSKNGENIITELLTNDKKKILRSDRTTGFYIKIYEDRGKAFIYDAENNVIYYITENENYVKNYISIRYYIFKVKDGLIY